MKIKLSAIALILTILLSGCEKDESAKKGNIDTSSISFTECNTGKKSTDPNIPSIRLIGQANGELTVKMINTEFCCGTDSITIDKTIDLDRINLAIIDNGPFTYCYCPHDIEFSLTSLSGKDYELILIESEHSYSRDTFSIRFKYSETLDTTITGIIHENMISNYPLEYEKTDFGGCNGMHKSVITDYSEEIDTLIFNEMSDSLKIFAGLNLTCCIDFGSESEIVGDTLIMRVNTLNDDFCNCICYYTFDFNYGDYMGQGFYYKFYIDNYKRFEGKFNLP